jgi:hypothetical protein
VRKKAGRHCLNVSAVGAQELVVGAMLVGPIHVIGRRAGAAHVFLEREHEPEARRGAGQPVPAE